MDLNDCKSHKIIIQTRRYDMRIIVTSMFRKLSTNHVKDNLLRNKHRHLKKTIGCTYNKL
jgi:hypothetical protein